MRKLARLAANDLRLIFRDPSVRLFLLLPVLLILFAVFALPVVFSRFPVLNDYVSIIVMAVSVQGSVMFGAIYSFVLVDEKDTRVAIVYGVLPVSNTWFILARLTFPYLCSAVFAVVLLLTQPFFDLSLFEILVYSTMTGLICPMIILWVTVMSKNKMEAITWQKISNTPIMLPLLAFIVPSYGYLFSISPAFWGYKAFEAMVDGGSFYLNILVGFTFSFLVLIWLTRRFSRVHFI